MTEKQKILVVEKSYNFSAEIMNFAIQLATRTECEILAVNIFGGDFHDTGIPEKIKKKAHKSLIRFRKSADLVNVTFTSLFMNGNAADSVKTLCHEIKRIGFIISADDTELDGIKGAVSTPVFTIKTSNRKKGKGEPVSDSKSTEKGGFAVRTIVYGILAAGLYAALFMNSELIMQYFNRGGIFAVLPILTVFVFSFVHGSFAGNLWSMLGIEAVMPQKS